MAKRKLSLLVQMMSNYSQLSEADRLHFADFIRSQQPPTKKAEKVSGKGQSVDAQLVKQLRERTGASMANCKATLTEANNDLNTAEQLLRARKLATFPPVVPLNSNAVRDE